MSADLLEGLKGRKLYLGVLGSLVEGFSLEPARGFWLVHTSLFDGEFKYMHFSQGKAGIKYLLQKGIPRKGSLLAEGSSSLDISLSWSITPGVMPHDPVPLVLRGQLWLHVPEQVYR